MCVNILHLVLVNQRPQILVALVAVAAAEDAGPGQHAVQLVAHVAAGDEGDTQPLPGLGPFGQLGGDGLGVADGGKAAGPYGHAVLNVGGGLLCGGDFGPNGLVADTVHKSFPFYSENRRCGGSISGSRRTLPCFAGFLAAYGQSSRRVAPP